MTDTDIVDADVLDDVEDFTDEDESETNRTPEEPGSRKRRIDLRNALKSEADRDTLVSLIAELSDKADDEYGVTYTDNVLIDVAVRLAWPTNTDRDRFSSVTGDGGTKTLKDLIP